MGVVQSKLTEWTTSSSSSTCTLPNPIAAGNALVVLIYFHNPSDTISSVADNLSPTTSYSVLSALTHDVTDTNQAFVSYVGFPTGSGTPTITVHLSASAVSGYICVLEVSGLAASPFDKSAISTSTGTATTSFTSGTTSTTSVVNELLLTWFGTLNVLAAITFSPGSNWSIVQSLNDSGLGSAGCVLQRTVSATGTYQGSCSKSGATISGWGMQIITLELVGISGSAGVAGATITYTGPSSGSVVADGSGNYSIPGLAPGTYTLTPSLSGYIFSPTSQSVMMSTSNVTGINFTATQVFTVTGNCGVSGATITYSGIVSGSTTANTHGDFTIANVPAGSLNITPSKVGFIFSPSITMLTISASVTIIITGYPASLGLTLTQTATENFIPNANPLNPSDWETPLPDDDLKAVNATCQATLNGVDDCVESWIATALDNDQYVQVRLSNWVVGNGQDFLTFVDTDVATATTGLGLEVLDNGGGGTAEVTLFDANNQSNFLYDNAAVTVASGDIFTIGSVGKVAFLLRNGVLLFIGAWTGGSGTVALECDTETAITDVSLAFVGMGSVVAPSGGSGGGGFGPGGSGQPGPFNFKFGF